MSSDETAFPTPRAGEGGRSDSRQRQIERFDRLPVEVKDSPIVDDVTKR